MSLLVLLVSGEAVEPVFADLESGTLAPAGLDASVSPGVILATAEQGALAPAGADASASPGTVLATPESGQLAAVGADASVSPGAMTAALEQDALALAGADASALPGAILASPEVGALAPAGFDPSASSTTSAQAESATLPLAGMAPAALGGPVSVALGASAMALEGLDASVSQAIIVALGYGALAPAGHAPSSAVGLVNRRHTVRGITGRKLSSTVGGNKIRTRGPTMLSAGNRIRLQCDFTDPSGAYYDPVTVRLCVRRPDKSVVTHVYPTGIQRTSAGLYYYPLLLDAAGRWVWRWESPDAGAELVDEGTVEVRASAF